MQVDSYYIFHIKEKDHSNRHFESIIPGGGGRKLGKYAGGSKDMSLGRALTGQERFHARLCATPTGPSGGLQAYVSPPAFYDIAELAADPARSASQ
uniref:Uncharacterized protein n=1 Tax=Plectus sambesii TaxID=2011161 RepID=A0A914UYN6_9BILA